MSHEINHSDNDTEGDIEFTAKKVPLSDHSADGGHGGTEMGWLVSYADMMTLLFGLFVLLYVLKSDKTKDADETMRKISNKYFNGQISDIKKTDLPIDNAMNRAEDKNVQFIETLTLENLKLKSEISNITKEVEVLKSLNLKNIKSVRTIATKESIYNTNLQKENSDLKNENTALNEKLNSISSAQQSYLMAIVDWTTEKHDIDLEISSENGKVFNFKKRIYKETPGVFEIDSRFGPGIEMWKAENYKPGKYQIKITLFNKNGNIRPANLKFSLFTHKNSFKSQGFQITEVGVPFIQNFIVDENGQIQVIK